MVANYFESSPRELLARVHDRHPVWTRLELAQEEQSSRQQTICRHERSRVSEYCEDCESPCRKRRVSGFPLQFVGVVVVFSDLPDQHLPFAISKLDAICRVCRVL